MLSFFLAAIETEEDRCKMQMIFDKYNDWLYSVALYYTEDQYDAEDLLYETYAALCEAISRVKLSSDWSMRSFLKTVLLNKYRDGIRKNKAFYNLLEKINTDEVYSLEERIVDKESYEKLLMKILTLKEKYKTVLMLKYVSDLKVCDISVLLNLPEKTVRKRLERAKRMLRKLLEEGGEST